MPDSTTICHLLDPIITSVAKYGVAPGQLVPTFGHPDGIHVQVRAAPLIADLEASRKVAGFLTHAATMFCSFCLCTKDQIEDLNIQSWQPRNSGQVRIQADEWLGKTTKAAREAQGTATGVRWTPLYRLPYWDPVKHVVLGFMHNWLEGILEHHLRNLWGIGRDERESEKVKEIEQDEQWTDSDVSDSADELEGLRQESAEKDAEAAIAMQSTLPHVSPTLSSTSTPTRSSTTPTAPEIHPNPYAYDIAEDDNDDDDEYVPIDNMELAFNFTNLQLLAIRNCIQNTTLPTWVQRPPSNLGEPSHGKLKAHEYLMLFICLFPLIIPEFWHTPNSQQLYQEHFFCFYNLVAATNIISSFKTSNADADSYTEHYTQYRAAIQRLFSYRPSKPNHHYAMHNGDLLKYWGPLPSFSEFPGERMNGMLQNINTNRRLGMYFYYSSIEMLLTQKLGDMDLTMLRQMSRRAHIDALLHDEDGLKDLADILGPVNFSDATPVPLRPTEASKILETAPKLEDAEYNALLQFLSLTGRPQRAFYNFPHPPDANILAPQAQRPMQVHSGEHTFSCEGSHKGNSAIKFYNRFTQTHDTGFIQTIWKLPLEGSMHTFMAVCPHKPLSPLEEGQAPFIQHPSFMTRIVDALPSNELVIIEPTQIITHLTTYQRPVGTYGIDRETLVVCWALNRGRQ